jgi:hypothetical protein
VPSLALSWSVCEASLDVSLSYSEGGRYTPFFSRVACSIDLRLRPHTHAREGSAKPAQGGLEGSTETHARPPTHLSISLVYSLSRVRLVVRWWDRKGQGSQA